MLTRRQLINGMTLGSGAVALSPFLGHMSMLYGKDDKRRLPKRFVFVVKGSGLQAQYINPKGLKHKSDKLQNVSLKGKKLSESMASLEPFKDRLTILQGLSGRMCKPGHSSFYGALGAYKASNVAPPSAATIDGHLSRKFPSVFNHVGLKMGNGSTAVAYPAISAVGKGKQLPFQCDPQLAYRNLFGSIAGDGDIRKRYKLSGSVLDFMSADIRKLRKALPGSEKEKLDHYLGGIESLRDRRVKLSRMEAELRKGAPKVDDKYKSRISTHHLEAHFDMAAAALITGITNVTTLITDDLTSSYQGLDLVGTVHSIGHGAGSGGKSGQECRNVIRKYHFDLIAGLAKKLKSVPEGNGCMLDNTLIVYLSDNSDKHHSTAYEWPMVVLGNLGGKWKSNGRYLAYPQYGAKGHRTIGNFLTTLCHAAGIPQDHFGQPDLSLDIKSQRGPLNELLV